MCVRFKSVSFTPSMASVRDPNEKASNVRTFKETAEACIGEIVKSGKSIVEAELNPVFEGVEKSQDGLLEELRELNAEMDRITENMAQVGVEKITLHRLREAKESLARTKKTLLKVHVRLGKLRTYENSDRLHRADTEMEQKSA